MTTQPEDNRLAYLASEYPGISHTFIFREIQNLRGAGITVETASIRRPEGLEKMGAAEKNDAANTLYIKETAPLRVLAAHAGLLMRGPARYAAMLRTALALAASGPRDRIKGLAYFAEAGILIDWMRRRGVDHIHVHFANPAATVAMIAAASGAVRFSMSVHGPDIFYNVEANLLAEKVRRAVFVRCISHYCRSQLMRLVPIGFWHRMHIVRCGVDPAVFTPRPQPDNSVAELLCLGRLVAAKGQHVLLEACGRLKRQNVNWHLTVVGGGEDRDSLEATARRLGIGEQVTFTGAVGQEAVHAFYDKADIFVLPSFAEGVPVVLMEAMAKEVAVVSTRITGIPELIDDGTDGLLVPPADVDALADALKGLIADPQRRHRLGRAGRRKVMSTYDLSANCQAMVALFDRHRIAGAPPDRGCEQP